MPRRLESGRKPASTATPTFFVLALVPARNTAALLSARFPGIPAIFSLRSCGRGRPRSGDAGGHARAPAECAVPPVRNILSSLRGAFALLAGFCSISCIFFSPTLRADFPADYSEVTTIRVGQCYARVAPAISVPIESPAPAPAKLKLTTRTAFFKKGEVWGVVDEERLAMEKRRLALAREQLHRKETNDADSGLARA